MKKKSYKEITTCIYEENCLINLLLKNWNTGSGFNIFNIDKTS